MRPARARHADRRGDREARLDWGVAMKVSSLKLSDAQFAAVAARQGRSRSQLWRAVVDHLRSSADPGDGHIDVPRLVARQMFGHRARWLCPDEPRPPSRRVTTSLVRPRRLFRSRGLAAASFD